MDDAAENAEFVRRIAARGEGAREAESVLCRRFAPRAELYGRKHLRDDQRARDLAQSVMLAVIEAARGGRVEDPTRIDRFVLGICRNVALRMREVERRAEPTDTAELDLIAFVPETEHVDRAALTRCVSALEPRGRSVVLLSFADGKSADEIAAKLSITAGNVRVLRHRAVAQLRRCMDQKSEAAR